MKPFRSRIALVLALGAALFAQACSDQSKKAEGTREDGSQASTAVSPADLDRTVALAKEKVGTLRFNLSVSRETKIEVLGAKPSRLPGLVDLRLRVTRDDRSAFRHVLVTPDLRYVMLGMVLRLGEIPRMRVDVDNLELKDAPVRGDVNAPVTIVEYSDFQCPYCRASQEAISQLLQEYEGKVKLVYRHYPLSIHPWAGDAAILSECARVQKPALFWKLHDYYYGSTQRLSRENILAKTQEQIAGDGIDKDRFNKCYLEQETAPVIKQGLNEGRSLGIRGTPSFVVNDVFISGRQPYEVLSAIVLEELGHDWAKDPSPKGLVAPKSALEGQAGPASPEAGAAVKGAEKAPGSPEETDPAAGQPGATAGTP